LTAASRLPPYRQSRDPAITFDRDIAAKPGKPGENNLSFTRSNTGKKLNAARLVSDRASRTAIQPPLIHLKMCNFTGMDIFRPVERPSPKSPDFPFAQFHKRLAGLKMEPYDDKSASALDDFCTPRTCDYGPFGADLDLGCT
jgi:hypothetical protein